MGEGSDERPDEIERLIAEIERLIGENRAREALALLDDAEQEEHEWTRLRELRGLAYRRIGYLDEALDVLDTLYEDGTLSVDGLGIYAAAWMDRYDKTGDREHLLHSRDLYAEAFALAPGNSYVGINSAAKSLLLGEPDEASTFLDLVEPLVEGEAVDYWTQATAAEVQLLRKNYGRAAELYREAVGMSSPEDRGDQRTTAQQADRLMTAMDTAPTDRAKVLEPFAHIYGRPPSTVSAPAHRRLRVFAFDPSASRSVETAGINELTLSVPWEHDDQGNNTLRPGPVGEYLEVVDVDPSSGCFYEPVDLDDPRLLATDGHQPSEGEPRFHQQMVYGVGMNVIGDFERALGRRALWSTRLVRDEAGKVEREEYVQRLRVHPHALREANAYYSPDRKALLFGYFPAEADDPNVLPNGMVFTSLSHDVIAHEMSHALLDGLHRRFAEPTNPDVLAFHEAFADIVALFQHFSHAEVLEAELARTRGNLATAGLLGQLAREFGQAIGNYGALRDAIGQIDPETKEWRPTEPDPDALRTSTEPHDRGSILVAAVFDAFVTIYDRRVADLIRIATQGTGELGPGALHPDLVKRMAAEAAKTARHMLRMCIRALDYCPPVDMTFGDYIRALITADVDAVPDDRNHYRLAIIEAFQRRGVYPADVRTLSEESLVWRPPRANDIFLNQVFEGLSDGSRLEPEWAPTADRRELWQTMRRNSTVVHTWLDKYCSTADAREIGLSLSVTSPKSIYSRAGKPLVEVHSVRLARRVTESGQPLTDIVIEILQRRRGYLAPRAQERVDAHGPEDDDDHGDFVFRGGCTLLVDPADGRVRYAIDKHILSADRLEAQRRFRGGESTTMRATYFGAPRVDDKPREPFAMLHRTAEATEERL